MNRQSYKHKRQARVSLTQLRDIHQDEKEQQTACTQCGAAMVKARQHFKSMIICFKCGHTKQEEQTNDTRSV